MRMSFMGLSIVAVIAILLLSFITAVVVYFTSLNIAPEQKRHIIPLELQVITAQPNNQEQGNETTAP